MIASRSPIVRMGIRAASPLAMVVATYLLFAGHNRPGGGFAAGLVFGAVIALRTVAGLQRPTFAVPFLAGGGLVVGIVAAFPLLFGDVLLDQALVDLTLPVLGTIKAGSALVLDAGVTLIVVGLVTAVLDGLGAAELAESAAPMAGDAP